MSAPVEVSEATRETITGHEDRSESNASGNNVFGNADVDAEKKQQPTRVEVGPDVIDIPDSALPLGHGGTLADEDPLSAPTESQPSPRGREEEKASDIIQPIAEEQTTQSQIQSPLPPASSPAPSPAFQSQSQSPLPSSKPTTPPPRLSRALMPAMVDLSDLILHSPSSQIVGTPFATNTTRFEYPFPDTSPQHHQSPSISESASGASSHSQSRASSPSAAGTGTFPTINFNMNMNMSTSPSTSASTTSALPLSFSLLSSPDLPSYNHTHSHISTHPKLKAQAAANPPMPPSLQKKRPKWSLNLLGRRKSSNASASSYSLNSPDSEGSFTLSGPGSPGSPGSPPIRQVGSPLGSPGLTPGGEGRA